MTPNDYENEKIEKNAYVLNLSCVINPFQPFPPLKAQTHSPWR